MTRLREKVDAFIADHQQFFDFIAKAILKYKKVHTEVAMAAYLGASNFISFNHNALCEDAQTEFESEAAYYDYQSQAPLQAILCTPNATMAVNYLAFFVALPAWTAQNDFRNISYMLGDLEFDKSANQVVADAQGYASYATYAAQAALN